MNRFIVRLGFFVVAAVLVFDTAVCTGYALKQYKAYKAIRATMARRPSKPSGPPPACKPCEGKATNATKK